MMMPTALSRPLAVTGRASTAAVILVALALLVGLAVGSAPRHVALGLGGLLLLGAVVTLLRRPDLATPLAFFALYVNLPVIAKSVPAGALLIAAMGLLLLLPLAANVLHRRQPIVLGPVFVFMMIFFVVQCIAAIGARNPDVATLAIGRFIIEGLILYAVLLHVVNDRVALRRAIWAAILAGSLLAGLALYQEVTRNWHDSFGGLMVAHGGFFDEVVGAVRLRPGGPIGDGNYLAQQLLILVPLAAAMALSARRLEYRLLAAAATAVVIGGTLVTFSRGAALALGIMCVMAIFLLRLRPHQVITLVATVLLAIVVIVPAYWARVQTVTELVVLANTRGSDIDDHSFRARLNLTMTGWHMFADHPVVGVGPENFADNYYEYSHYVDSDFNDRYARHYAHNMYVTLLAETGVAGTVVFGGMVLTALLLLRRVQRTVPQTDKEMTTLAAALQVAIIGFMISSLFLHLAYIRYFIMLLTFAGALVQIATREHRQSSSSLRLASATVKDQP